MLKKVKSPSFRKKSHDKENYLKNLSSLVNTNKEYLDLDLLENQFKEFEDIQRIDSFKDGNQNSLSSSRASQVGRTCSKKGTNAWFLSKSLFLLSSLSVHMFVH